MRAEWNSKPRGRERRLLYLEGLKNQGYKGRKFVELNKQNGEP